MIDGELGPEARALLDAAREGLSPDAAAVRRVRARVDAAAAGAATAALAVKLVVLALIAGAAVGAGFYAMRAPAPAARPALEIATPVERETRAQPGPPPRAAVDEASPAGNDEALITIEDVPASPHRRPAQHRPAAAPAPAASVLAPAAVPARPIELGREVALVDQAMTALGGGDAAAALGVLAQYDREAAGTGQLAEDAAAIEIEALCALGDPAARGKLAAFDQRFPRSVQRARLGRACR